MFQQNKMAAIHAPFMDSSIDSDHSWESHSTGSSGRGTQHSDQGSVGSAKRVNHILPGNHDRDETDGEQNKQQWAGQVRLLVTAQLRSVHTRLD